MSVAQGKKIMKLRAGSIKFGAGLLLGVLCNSATVQAAEKIVWASYGGAWADVMKRVCIKPFTEQTGIEVALAATDDSMAQIRVQQMTKNILWDISPTERDSLPTGENNGWFLPIDWKVVDPDNKLPPLARKKYAIGSVAYSTVIAYRTDKIPAGKTFRGWQDFWNVKDFPGPRSLRNSPVENLEFALLADGVEPKDVYTVLATPEGLDRAFKKMDEIKPSILVWWTSGNNRLNCWPAVKFSMSPPSMVGSSNCRMTRCLLISPSTEVLWTSVITRSRKAPRILPRRSNS